jgi:NAD(P)-dependent dehydrogenase (short-subunit alcohol dehydrogenase family)
MITSDDSHRRSTMARLAGKVALISGGARGQGAVEAQLFAREGAKVVFGDLLDDDGKHVEEEIRRQGGKAIYVHLDVTQAQDWQRAVQTAESHYGRLDILVNNAGITIHGTIEETSEADWDRIMAINLKGVFLGTKYVLPAMRRAGGGSIINISSGAGIAPAPGTSAAYAATKGGVRIFSKATAVQHAKDHIRCNSVHPGPIDTPMVRGPQTDPARLAELTVRVPLGRLGTSEEIAYGVLYLASDESSYVTGSELVIDGGRTAQ